MNEARRRLGVRLPFGRFLMLGLVLVLAAQLGCGKRAPVVVSNPDKPGVKDPAKESPIQWTMRPVKYDEDIKNLKENNKLLRDGGGGGGGPGIEAKKMEAEAGERRSDAPAKTPPLAAPPPPAEGRPVTKSVADPHPVVNAPVGIAGGAPRPDTKSKNGAVDRLEQLGGHLQGQPGRDGREANFADDGGVKGKPGDKDKAPQVWKRDRQRPTFARVYVGDNNSLELVSLQVTTTIEGPRARTVVDHIFRNPHDKRLEGTFEYPLPTGASPSYFAMFLGQTRDTVPERFVRRGNVPPISPDALASLSPSQIVREVSTADWGTLQEARVVNKERALETYEEIVRSQIDPALLEYAGGNTFSGRVFPIPPKGYNRVIIAYEELLPISQGKVHYRYPLPDCKLTDLQFTLQSSAGECKEPDFKPEGMKVNVPDKHIYTKTWTDKGPGGDVTFSYAAPFFRQRTASGEVQRPAVQMEIISGRHGSDIFAYARIRPELKSRADKPFASHAVFLLDISQSEHADRFAVSMKLMKKILEADTAITHFNVLAFNVGATWVEPKGWLPNNPAGREEVFKRLDGVVLEGATDFGAALAKLAKPDFTVGPSTPVNVFVLSDGQITWGEPEVGPLVSRFDSRCTFPTRFHCYRTGLGAENAELYDSLTRKGGGTFNVLTEADLAAAALAHRSQCLQVERVRWINHATASENTGIEVIPREVLVAGRRAAVYPGGDIVVACKLNKTGQTQIVVEGTYLGEKYSMAYDVWVEGTGELAPRGWGELAVASLLALDDPKLDSLVTAYCQQFGIGSRVASFLVLENNADYQRLNLEEERGKTVPGGDLSKFLDDAWQSLGKPMTARLAFERFLSRVSPRAKLLDGESGPYVQKLLDLLKDEDFDIAGEAIVGALLMQKDVPADYLKARDADRRNVETYLVEAQRRIAASDPAGAIRVLSSVIEENPTRSDALRLVGYRLLDLKQPAQAVRLFQQVQRSRPFEPHCYRDLARSLEESGKLALAALQYEIVLAGQWHGRFRDDLKVVAREEYARMMQQAIRAKAVSPELLDHFGDRLERMADPSPRSDLRVTISWNTDGTDIDLWVIEPDGTRCFYQNNKTAGGQLSEDQTQGYGPERYHTTRPATPGEYTVIVHYFSANRTLLGGETHVNVVVAKNAGTPQEVVERRTVILKKEKEQIEVCKIKF